MKKLFRLWFGVMIALTLGCEHVGPPPPVYIPDRACKPVGFPQGSKPMGFNGVPWGTELANLQEMVYLRTDPSHGGIVFYTRKDDGYKLKNGRALPVQYGFWQGKFYVGMVVAQGPSDWEALKSTVFDRYGRGAKPFINTEEYIWYDKDVTMVLRYDQSMKRGIYYIRSAEIEKQMKSYY